MNILRLKEIREDHDLYQKDVANLLGITQQQYNKYELGINVISLEKNKHTSWLLRNKYRLFNM